MFAKLLSRLLPSVIEGKIEANYEYFESTRDAPPGAPVADLSAVGGNQTAMAHRPAAPLSDLQENFYAYLFGSSAHDEPEDPLGNYIARHVQVILRSPGELLAHLPVMPKSLCVVMEQINNPDFDVTALMKVIEQEPALAADLVKLANSARYRRGEREICDLKNAFMVMGSQGLLEGVLQSYIARFTPKPTIYYKLFGEKIWQHALQTASLSARLATDNGQSAGLAYFAGLLKNLGTMLIFQLMLDAFTQVDPNAAPGSQCFKSVLRRYSDELTLAVAKFWQLPAPVLEALGSPGKAPVLSSLIADAKILSKLKELADARLLQRKDALEEGEKRLTSQPARKMLTELFG